MLVEEQIWNLNLWVISRKTFRNNEVFKERVILHYFEMFLSTGKGHNKKLGFYELLDMDNRSGYFTR